MNYLARKIGIWYHTKEWADTMREKILMNLPPMSVYYYSKDRIVLTDDTTITFYKESGSQRGMALSESYVQPGISLDFYNHRIKVRTMMGIAKCYFINERSSRIH